MQNSGFHKRWFSHRKTFVFLGNVCFLTVPEVLAPHRRQDSRGESPDNFRYIFAFKKLCAEVIAKNCAKTAAKRPRKAKVVPGVCQDASKIAPVEGPKRASKSLWYKNFEMSRNHIIYYILATSGHLRKSLFSKILGSETV